MYCLNTEIVLSFYSYSHCSMHIVQCTRFIIYEQGCGMRIHCIWSEFDKRMLRYLTGSGSATLNFFLGGGAERAGGKGNEYVRGKNGHYCVFFISSCTYKFISVERIKIIHKNYGWGDITFFSIHIVINNISKSQLLALFMTSFCFSIGWSTTGC